MATVLVVDDRAINREVTRATLDLAGHRVIEASEGRQALTMAQDNHPDVVVADLLMPGMDGYDFAHELRMDPVTADIPVLFFTANYRQDEVAPLAARVGVSKVLLKSADPVEFLHAVDEVLRAGMAPVHLDVAVNFDAEHLQTVNAKLLEQVRALDRVQARFATMAETSPMGIVFGGQDGCASYVNPRLAQITRKPVAELLGEGWQYCLDAGHRHATLAWISRRADADVDEIRHPYRLTEPDGRHRWLTVLVRRVQDSDNVPAGFIAMIDDVTSIVEAEERRKSADRAREALERRQVTERFESLARLSRGVAHDFNNLLHLILSHGEFLTEAVTDTTGTLLDPKQADIMLGDLGQIHRAGERAALLTHQLLAFGGREVVKPTVLDVNALVGDVRDTIAATLGAHVTVTTDTDPDLYAVLADGEQLHQVLRNLAVNACDAMPDGGSLHITTANTSAGPDESGIGSDAGDHVHIVVTDTGVGMPPEVLRHAIEPFFTTKPAGQGTGLGLATSYGVVRQAGGHLTIESTPGHGTSVHIYLPPTARRAENSEPAATSVSGLAAHGTILLVEDEDGIRKVVSRLLVQAGYNVLPAANGQDALAIADRHRGRIDVVLTDVVMPQMNGRQLAEALTRQRPGIQVLFMSGYAALIMTEQGLLEPGCLVLSKPFTKADLLTAVRDVVGVGAAAAAAG